MSKLEALASLEHEQWTHWMSYLFKQCKPQSDGSLVIPEYLVDRYETLMEKSFDQLTEKEKESDLEWAIKTMNVTG